MNVNFAQVTGPTAINVEDVTRKVNIADNDVARLMYVISIALLCLPLLEEGQGHERIRELGKHANYRQYQSRDGVKLIVAMARASVAVCHDLKLFVEADVTGFDTSNRIVALSAEQTQATLLHVQGVGGAAQVSTKSCKLHFNVYCASWMRRYYTEPMHRLTASCCARSPAPWRCVGCLLLMGVLVAMMAFAGVSKWTAPKIGTGGEFLFWCALINGCLAWGTSLLAFYSSNGPRVHCIAVALATCECIVGVIYATQLSDELFYINRATLVLWCIIDFFLIVRLCGIGGACCCSNSVIKV